MGDSLKSKDLDALKRKGNVPGMLRIVPVTLDSVTGIYQNESYRFTVLGVSPEISDIMKMYPDQGRFISEDDVSEKADVIFLGSKVTEKLFGGAEAIGEKIKIKERTFRVIGLLASKGSASMFNFDEMAMIPYTTAQLYLSGGKFFHEFMIEAASQDLIPSTVDDIKTTLRESHGITDPEKDDFHVQTQADLANKIGVVTNVLTLFLVAVAAISLIVGGVGIMNIMLVSVTERTREIGLRKAIGATDSDILTQFLLEAVFLTAAGGIIGIIFGALFSFLAAVGIAKFGGLSWTFIFPVGAALEGLGVSAGVGLIFGLYPARQAARKSPIEALRYE
jgi:putative ABC transport system permease protein